MGAAETIVSKGRFAEICNVSPGRVTQWIAEGKIIGDALVGDGRSAKIVVAIAQKQLRSRIDSGQSFGNGLNTKLRPDPPKAEPEPPRPQDTPQSPDDFEAGYIPEDGLDAEIKRERLVGLQRLNRKAAEDEAAAQGRYTDTMAARRQMGIVAVETLRVFEGALPEIATAIASRFEVGERDALQLLNELFRTVRLAAAEKAKAAAAKLGKLVPDETTEPAP